jgi:hypothetical protein
VSPEETKMLFYLRSFLRKALVAQNQVLMLKHKRIEYKHMHSLNTLLDELLRFLFDLEYSEQKEVPMDDSEVVNQKKQMLIRDVGILDIIINILNFPLKIKKAYERPMDMIVTINKLMASSYRVLRNAIMEYRPNELYASQWLGFLIEDVFNNHSNVLEESRKTLKELYDNNERVLETRIDMDIVFKFVYFLAENKQTKYFDFFDALIICNDKPISINQTRIARIILDDDNMKSKLILRINQVGKSHQLQVSMGDHYIFNNVSIEEFKPVCKRNNAVQMYKFVIRSIKLFSNLCLGDNKIAKDGLRQLYPLRYCVKIIINEKLDFDMRSAFAELTHHLWSLSDQTKKRLNKLSRAKVWTINGKAEHKYDMFFTIPHKTYEEFLNLHEYLCDHYFVKLLENVQKVGIQPSHLEFTLHALGLLRDLIEMRVLNNSVEISQVKHRLQEFMYHEFNGEYPELSAAEKEEMGQLIISCKVICLDILKLFIYTEIDLEVDKIFKWIRKKCVETLADRLKLTTRPVKIEESKNDMDTILNVDLK